MAGDQVSASVTYGPIFIGVVFNILLYGIMITQTYMYFQVYKRDRTWMKAFVLFLFLCDTVNCAFDIAFLYIPLVNNFGNFEILDLATWVFATDPVMTGLIAGLVQLFFAWRVKVLTSNWYAVVLIALCAVAQFCGGLGTSIAIGMVPQFTHFQEFQVVVIIWLAFSAVADTLITISLVWHLRTHRTGMPVTDDIINKIIRLTMQTGLLTALCAIIDLVLFLASSAGYHLTFNLPLSKLYTNSLMSSLNSRQGWQYDSSGVSQGREPQGRQLPRSVNVLRSEQTRHAPAEIYIDVESHEMVDVDRKGVAAFRPDDKLPPLGEHRDDMARTDGSDSAEAV
ncbi:hypothetical protein BD413DRAFT_65351 [Trametes elegans]|nr:hypothetical protein BD413DRAFT_65351 [Trametes elegans]